jgi:FtsP/CotA-like multicopper oxidase with cupredoxin domain
MRARSWTIALAVAGVAALVSAVGALTMTISTPRPATPAPASGLPSTTCTLAAGTRTCHLWAETGTISLPGPTTLPIWGYALGDGTASAGSPTAPGPAIVAVEGETIELVLHNGLAEPTSLAVPGLTTFPADTAGVAPGSSRTYTFTAERPGTFLYEAGLTTGGDRQVALGLVGPLVIRPASAPGTAYGDPATAFDQEVLLVATEIDPRLQADPANFDLRDYHPRYWLLNGRAYPETEGIDVAGGTRVLLRYVNAGLGNESLGSPTLHAAVVAADGHRLPHPYEVLAETVPAGATLDAIATIPLGQRAGTIYLLGTAALRLDNDAVGVAGGAVPIGGRLSLVTVTTSGLDATGPLTELALSAALASDPTTVVVTASADDRSTGGSYIADGEYFVDGTGTCSPGTGRALTLSGRRGPAVTLVGTLGGVTEGRHTLVAHSRDAAGQWGPCSDPRSVVIDRTGPVVSGSAVAPNPTFGAGSVLLTAEANDPLSAGVQSEIAAAEWFTDPTTAPGAGQPMGAADGAFDAPTEGVQATIDVTSWAPGAHTVFVRARDAAGNWGSPTSASVLVGDVIFADGFETGSLGAWSRSVGGPGNPVVTRGAALRGTTWGMAVALGADAYVVDEHPSAETSYDARFWYDPNGWNPNGASGGGRHRILVGRNAAGDALFAVEVRRVKSGKTTRYEVRLVVVRAGGTSATKWYALGAAGGHAIEIAWQSASPASASLAIDGQTKQTLGLLNTSGRSLERVELGVQGAPTGMTGAAFFDEFVSTRSTPVGP